MLKVFHRTQRSVNSVQSVPTTPTTTTTPDSQSIHEKQNPFATPYSSHPGSHTGSYANLHAPAQRYFHSRRIRKGEVDKPWLTNKDPKEKWITIIPIIGILVGLALSGLLVYDGLRGVVNHKYCPVYSTDFTEGFDNTVWTKEAEVGGFGNGQFEQTTTTDENVFVKNGELVIRATLQNADLVNKNTVIDLGSSCSSDMWYNCITTTNTTNGTIIQPVKSGRINTKKRHSIKYGRIEVEALTPVGDWLWPAIWMLPVNSTYGQWPQSGEIDILESRGNNHNYDQGGNNIMSSALHWGPDSINDAWWRTNVKRNALHSTFANKWHTFGLEWSEKYLFTYIDNRLLQVLYVNFNPKQGLWQRGNFPLSSQNGTRFVDPWSQTGQPSTPFDEDFYLIINLAVGGTNGWFQDGKNQKPWVDGSPTAKKDFWTAQKQWLPTWTQPELRVKSVKMWQQAGYNGCPA